MEFCNRAISRFAQSGRHGHKWLALALCIGAALLQAACFVYLPADPGQVKTNENIRVTITGQEVLRLSQQFGFGSPQLEGQLATLTADSLGLAVWVGKGFTGDFATARQTIPLVRRDVLEVQRKQFSARRSVLFALGVGAGAAILLNRLGLIDIPFLDTSEPPAPPTPDSLRSLRRRSYRF